MTSSLASRVMSWADRLHDAQSGLLWDQDRRRHMVRESAWFAFGLLRAGETARAEQMLHAVLDQQWNVPGAPWHGTFRRHPGEPDPTREARIWRDFDPNWRQFIGSTLLLALRDGRLSSGLQGRIEHALRLTLEGEPPDRVRAEYTNIALLRAWLEAEAGADLALPGFADRGLQLARAVSIRQGRGRPFDEFNSPTYYGVDLFALGLWTRHSSQLARSGEALARRLWQGLRLLFHRDLHNLCGPYSRACGMDMQQYAGMLGLAVSLCCGVAAHPPITGRVPHGHDLCMVPLLDFVLEPVEPLPEPPRERPIRAELHDDALATMMMDRDRMFGAQTGGAGRADGQFHPLTAHWRHDGGVAWLRARSSGHLDAALDGIHAEVRMREAHRPLALEFSHPPRIDGRLIELGDMRLRLAADHDLQLEGCFVHFPLGLAGGEFDFTHTND